MAQHICLITVVLAHSLFGRILLVGATRVAEHFVGCLDMYQLWGRLLLPCDRHQGCRLIGAAQLNQHAFRVPWRFDHRRQASAETGSGNRRVKGHGPVLFCVPAPYHVQGWLAHPSVPHSRAGSPPAGTKGGSATLTRSCTKGTRFQYEICLFRPKSSQKAAPQGILQHFRAQT